MCVEGRDNKPVGVLVGIVEVRASNACGGSLPGLTFTGTKGG